MAPALTSLVVWRTGLPASYGNPKGYSKYVDLWEGGPKRNVELQINNITARIIENLDPVAADLLRIAACAYLADTSIPRGGYVDLSQSGWYRDFHLVVPVHVPDVWNKDNLADKVGDLLTFLSGDASISIEFQPYHGTQVVQEYIRFPEGTEQFRGAKTVALFSGGLDSLAGAVRTTVEEGEPVLLVSHRSTPIIDNRQKELVAELQKLSKVPVSHVSVWIRRSGGQEAVENSQRLRSFLYMSLATILAHHLKIPRIRYSENGITTFNLPLSEHRIGTRSTRTTHPRVVKEFCDLTSAALGWNVSIENPFLLMTKAEVLKTIATQNGADLIRLTRSCSHTFPQPRETPHCGVCFQCVLRRFSSEAANLQQADPVEAYAKDVFTADLAKDEERANCLDFSAFAIKMDQADERAFAIDCSELGEILPYLGGGADQAGRAVFGLYKRYAKEVTTVICAKSKEYEEARLKGKLKKASLLVLLGGQEHLVEPLRRYALRLSNIVATGLKTQYRDRKPKLESAIQTTTETVLQAANEDLQREWPHFSYGLRWHWAKPDLAPKDVKLFVELKLVKSKADRPRAHKELIAEIARYRKIGAFVLAIVYRTGNYLPAESDFAAYWADDEKVLVKVVGS